MLDTSQIKCASKVECSHLVIGPFSCTVFNAEERERSYMIFIPGQPPGLSSLAHDSCVLERRMNGRDFGR